MVPEKPVDSKIRLYPPIEVMRKMVQKKKTSVPRNPIIRFLKTFFGEGF